MQIAILVFEKLTALDAIGPYEVLSRVPGVELTFVSTEAGPLRTDTGRLGLQADATLEDIPEPDIFLIPGGEGNRPLMKDERVLDWVRHAHEHSTWTTSVCTGSLVLGAAGSSRASGPPRTGPTATRWPSTARRPSRSASSRTARCSPRPACRPGSTWRSTLVARQFDENVAKAIQLGIEYDPDPPFDSGSPEKAAPELVELIRGLEGVQA